MVRRAGLFIFEGVKLSFPLRYFIEFSYSGSAYHGWQRQPNATSVQEVLENRLSTLLGVAITLMGAGRTDAGVHARQMFAHFDWEGNLDTVTVIFKLNAFLPDDIAVKAFHRVKENAHARFDAIARSYEYKISTEKDPFAFAGAHYIKQALDLANMNRAAKLLIGTKDFECFSKAHSDVRTFICTVSKAFWEETDEGLVFHITADRFLRNMVRAVVGTLLEVGRGAYPPAHVKDILKSHDRSKAGPSVPAKGLYLTSVAYPNTIYGNG